MSHFGSNPISPADKNQLQTLLSKDLGPEFLSERTGPGGIKLKYIDAGSLINIANEVFSFNGWSHSIISQQIDFMDERDGKYSVGISSVVRVTISDGTFHEDIGYGCIDNCRQKGMALEKAKKESVTDALKRALRHFGNVLGNCVYNKQYLKAISRVNHLQKPPLNHDNLYRSDSKSNKGPPTTSKNPTDVTIKEEEDYLDDLGDDAFRAADLECLPKQYLVDDSIDLNYRYNFNNNRPSVNSTSRENLSNHDAAAEARVPPRNFNDGHHQRQHIYNSTDITPKTSPKLKDNNTIISTASSKIEMVNLRNSHLNQISSNGSRQNDKNRHHPYPQKSMHVPSNENVNIQSIPYKPVPVNNSHNGQVLGNNITAGYGIKQAMNRPVVPPGQRAQKSFSTSSLDIPGFT